MLYPVCRLTRHCAKPILGLCFYWAAFYGKAVFAVENAYFENCLNYAEFNKAIDKLAETAQLKTMQDGYNWNNPVTKNIMLFRTMADTL